MDTGLPAEGFLRHKGLILAAAGGAVVEGGLLTLFAPNAKSVAPQVTALPSLAAYHDLRWLFADSQSWPWFAGLVAAVLVTRTLLRGADRAGLADADARGHPRVRGGGAAVLLAVPGRVPDHARHRGLAQPRRDPDRLVAPAAARPRGAVAARQLRRRDRGGGGDHPPARRGGAAGDGRDRPGQRQGLVRAGAAGGPRPPAGASVGAGQSRLQPAVRAAHSAGRDRLGGGHRPAAVHRDDPAPDQPGARRRGRDGAWRRCRAGGRVPGRRGVRRDPELGAGGRRVGIVVLRRGRRPARGAARRADAPVLLRRPGRAGPADPERGRR
jgi:hypothetical protein